LPLRRGRLHYLLGLPISFRACGRSMRVVKRFQTADSRTPSVCWGWVPSSGRVVDGDPVDLNILGARRPGWAS